MEELEEEALERGAAEVLLGVLSGAGRRVPAEPSLHREDVQARSLLHFATAVSLGSGIPKRAQMKRRPLFVVPREPTVLS